MSKRITSIGSAVSLLTLSITAHAHHSAASLDSTRTVDLVGTVKEFHWVNPHSWIVISTTDASGKESDATVEANGPGYLARQGWKRETLVPGDRVTLTIFPMRDGSPGGGLVKAKLTNGKELDALPGGPPPGNGDQKGPPVAGGKDAK